jgi:hypothetical protein
MKLYPISQFSPPSTMENLSSSNPTIPSPSPISQQQQSPSILKPSTSSSLSLSISLSQQHSQLHASRVKSGLRVMSYKRFYEQKNSTSYILLVLSLHLWNKLSI